MRSQVAEIHSSGRDPQVKHLDSLTEPVGRARPVSCLELTRIPNLESDEVALDDCDKCSDARASSESWTGATVRTMGQSPQVYYIGSDDEDEHHSQHGSEEGSAMTDMLRALEWNEVRVGMTVRCVNSFLGYTGTVRGKTKRDDGGHLCTAKIHGTPIVLTAEITNFQVWEDSASATVHCAGKCCEGVLEPGGSMCNGINFALE